MKTVFTIQCSAFEIAIADLFKCQFKSNGMLIYEMSRINVPRRYRDIGIGRRLLNEVLAEADACQVVVRLTPVPSGEMKLQALRNWYRRNGFTPAPDGYWYRVPRQPAAVQATSAHIGQGVG
jgi:GNAT superfamily N-acetyltransferase